MAAYLLRRLVQAALILVGVSFVTFFLLYVLPADPVRQIAGRAATAETVENIRQQLGLDQPFIVQYARYMGALFQGDDPATAEDEAFDQLLPGFYDWGTWFQGEIAGGYAVSNSNLISHRARIHVEPGDSISGGLMLYKFSIDQPATFEGGVTSSSFAGEADVYVDWQIRERLTASFVVAFTDPQAAAEQAYGRTKSFRYGLVFLAYKY